MIVLSVRGRITPACLASEEYNVEMELLAENDRHIFLHLNTVDDGYYTVAESSIFDYMTGNTDLVPQVQFLEEYNSWAKAQKSVYKPYFAAMRRTLNMLG